MKRFKGMMNARFVRFPHLALAGGLMLVLASGLLSAQAQPTFGVHLSEETQAALAEADGMGVVELAELLASEARLSYEGGTPAEAQLLVFFLSDGPGQQSRIQGNPFPMEPGEVPIEQWFPGEMFIGEAERLFPGEMFDRARTFSFPGEVFAAPAEGEFPQEVISEMPPNGADVGLVFFLVPVDEDLRVESQHQPLGLIFFL
ncbi:MAG: hypothetical protein GVY15_02085 [Bacteroidetes bacterium]|jgi:hypothetical protein|nr:hypothetical protein [Bacteroidota bacterium]